LLDELLTKHREARALLLTRLVLVQYDVVTKALRGVVAVHRVGGEALVLDDAIEDVLGGRVEIACRRALLRVVEDRGESTAQLPGGEEERPINVLCNLFEREITELARSDEGRLRYR
jgi:hypothetical protein